MTTAESDARFVPLHDAHAIDQLVATVQFASRLTDGELDAIGSAMAHFQEQLPNTHQVRGVTFNFGPEGITPVQQADAAAPDGFVRFLADGKTALKELRVDRDSLVFRTQVYTRWDAVWKEARSYFDKVLALLEPGRVSALGLLYVDKFIWMGPPDACRPSFLLRDDSPYMTMNSLASQDLWHCHSGRFLKAAADVKRLEVVDIDCLDEPHETAAGAVQRRVLRIATAVTDIYNQPGFEPRKQPQGNVIDDAEVAFSGLHIELKRVLSEIISDTYAARVGLNINAAAPQHF